MPVWIHSRRKRWLSNVKPVMETKEVHCRDSPRKRWGAKTIKIIDNFHQCIEFNSYSFITFLFFIVDIRNIFENFNFFSPYHILQTGKLFNFYYSEYKLYKFQDYKIYVIIKLKIFRRVYLWNIKNDYHIVLLHCIYLFFSFFDAYAFCFPNFFFIYFKKIDFQFFSFSYSYWYLDVIISTMIILIMTVLCFMSRR